MRIAIAGGTGTLGRRVAEELRSRGHDVRVLSRSSAEYLRRIAWTPALRAYFTTSFVKVLADRQGDALYVRRGLRPR